jgi:hypothetical protein
MDFATLGSSMSLRQYLGFGKQFEDLDSRAGSDAPPWWGMGASDGEDDFYGGSYAKDLWKHRYGSSMSMQQFDRFGRKQEAKGAGSSLALRNLHRCGASISMLAMKKFSKKCSAMDCSQLGSALALRSIPKPQMPSGSRFAGYPGHSLSTLDYMFLSSSLSLGSMSFGRRSLSLHGARRFHDPLGLGPDGMDEFGHERRGVGAESTLALRNFARIGKPLAVLDKGSDAGLPRLASKMSVLNTGSLGSSLSLRRHERGGQHHIMLEYRIGLSLLLSRHFWFKQ